MPPGISLCNLTKSWKNNNKKKIQRCRSASSLSSRLKKNGFSVLFGLEHRVMVSTWWWLLSCSNNYPPQNKLDNCSHFNSLIHYTSFVKPKTKIKFSMFKGVHKTTQVVKTSAERALTASILQLFVDKHHPDFFSGFYKPITLH